MTAAKMIGGMRMKIVNMPVRVPVSHIKHGHVFKYKDKYYMATNAYYGDEMRQKNKVYIELETGFWKSFTDEFVEPIENIQLVVGQGIIYEEDEDDDSEG